MLYTGNLPGDKSPYWKEVPFELLGTLLEESMHIRMKDKPYNYILGELQKMGFEMDRDTLTSKIRYYYDGQNYKEIRDVYNLRFVMHYLHHNFKPLEIVRLLYPDNPPKDSKLITDYKDGILERKFGIKYFEVKKVIWIERIEHSVSSGILTIKELSDRLGFPETTLQRLISEHYGGIDNLVDLFFKPVIYTHLKLGTAEQELNDLFNFDVDDYAQKFWEKDYNEAMLFLESGNLDI